MEYLGIDKPVNKKKPVVSICIQTYQHGSFIAECLEGMLIQKTDFPLEIIVGEDDSTDGTRDICKRYAEKHPEKIRLFLRSHKDKIYINGTKTGRFNFLANLKAARGKYFALCDGDDYWTDPLKLQKQVDFLEANSDYNICFHRVLIFHQEKNNFTEDTITREVPQSTDISDLIAGNYIHTPSVVLRNNFTIPTFFQEIKTGDWALYLTAVKNSKIYKFNDVMGVYRVHNQGIWSLTHQKGKTEDMVNLMCIMMANKLVDSVHLPLLRKYVYSPLFDVLNFETESHNYLKAFRYLYETTQKMELSTMKVTLQYLKYRFLKLLYKK